METEGFKLTTRDEVAQFEQLLGEYMRVRAGHSYGHFSLVDAFDIFQLHPEGGKLFSALLDIRISFVLLHQDVMSIGATWNQFFSKGKIETGSALSSQAAFFGKMEIHRASTSFVFRYRALWDKLMGFLLMTYAPEQYDHYRRAKSRRKEFLKIMRERRQVKDTMLDDIDTVLTDFDRQFRTPEAHGTGALRKWTFLMVSLHENPAGELIGYWNIINKVMEWFGAPFRKDKKKPTTGSSVP